eukprot:gene5334-3833_t
MRPLPSLLSVHALSTYITVSPIVFKASNGVLKKYASVFHIVYLCFSLSSSPLFSKMSTSPLYLTDYVANEESMRKLRESFMNSSEQMDFKRFKQIICSLEPEIKARNEQIYLDRTRNSHTTLKGFGLNNPLSTKGFQALSEESKKSFVPHPSERGVEKASFALDDSSSPLTTVEPSEESVDEPSSATLEESHEKASAPTNSIKTSPSSEAIPTPAPVENDFAVGTKPWFRRSRQRSMEELAGKVVVEPLKAIFNHIDRQNRLIISWDDMVQYLVEESGHRTSSMEETCRTYTFSRKMKGNNEVEESWLINNAADPIGIKKLLKKQTSNNAKKAPTNRKTAWETFAPPVEVPERLLIHFIHGLPGHMMFAVSTRSTPLALYKKSDLKHFRTLTPEELGNTVPEMVEYLPQPDTILCYSTSDASIRGWTFLLSKNNTTSLTPLKIDGQVQHMRTCTDHFPHSVFVGTTQGNVIRVDVPSLRSGTEMRIVQVFDNLHDPGCGGVVDFVVSETHVFSTSFDHRILSINIQTGNKVVIGNCIESVYLLEYSAMFSLVLGVSYKNELLCWDAKGLAAVPGTAFHHALEKEHFHRIKRLICVKDLPHCLTIDTLGCVKMWDLRMQQCIQTTSVNGTTTDVADPEAVYGMKGKADDSSNSYSMHTIVDATYFEELHEMVSCTSDTIYLLQYNLREDVSLCDFDQVNRVFYDVREKPFVLQGSTRISTWDALGGYRKRVVDRALTYSIPPAKRDIAALCVDDVGSRIFISVSTSEIEVHDTKNMNVPLEVISTSSVLTDMIYSNFYKLLAGVTPDGTLFLRNEEERIPSTFGMRISSTGLYSLTISEELGLLACCDEKGHLFLHDIKKVENPSQVCRVDRRVLCCKLLGSSPILASGHDGGDICLWSCPPIAEVFLQLVVFNAFTRLRSTEEIRFFPVVRNGDGGGHAMNFLGTPSASMTSLSGKPDAQWTRRSLILPRSFEDLVNNNEQRKEYINERNKKNSATRIPDGYEVTTLAYDNDSHRLFCAESTGNVSFFCLCGFFQWFQIKPVTFETRNMYFLDHWGIGAPECVPRYITTVHPHSKEGILTIRWISFESVLITSGVDRKVCLFDADGNECGVLSKARLPQRDTLEDSRSSLYSSFNQFRATDLPVYRLPHCTARRNLRKEMRSKDTDLYCRHPIDFRSEENNLNLPEDHHADESSETEKHYSSFCSAKQSSKPTSTKLVDFVGDTINNSVSLGNEGAKKSVFLKDSVATSLATSRAERNNKLAEEKVDTFPSSVRAETLSKLDECRPHSSQYDKQPPVLFACETEPTSEKLLQIQHPTSHHHVSPAVTEVDLSPLVYVIPKLPQVTRTPRRVQPRLNTPMESFVVNGNAAITLWQKNTYTALQMTDTPNLTERSAPTADLPRPDTSCSKPRRSPKNFSKTFPNGTVRSKCSSGRQPAFREDKSSCSKPPPKAPPSHLDRIMQQYQGELRRCIAGEAAEQRDRLRLNPKTAFSSMGRELKMADRKILEVLTKINFMQDNDSNRENQFRDAGADPSEGVAEHVSPETGGRTQARKTVDITASADVAVAGVGLEKTESMKVASRMRTVMSLLRRTTAMKLASAILTSIRVPSDLFVGAVVAVRTAAFNGAVGGAVDEVETFKSRTLSRQLRQKEKYKSRATQSGKKKRELLETRGETGATIEAYGSRGNDAENGNGYDQQDDQQNTDERGYYPRRGNGASPTQKWKWNNNNTNGSYNDNQHDEAPVAEERECGEDRPTQFQRSSPPAPSGKPQRRQRAPHLRSNCRNEDEVLALFECHHQQKGISLDNYGNIPVEMVPRDIEPVELFSELHVCPSLAENIERCGYKSPTPVQRYGIPVALQGNDLMACAQTGSGKTAAFLIPIANYILINGVSPAKKGVSFPIGLVLAPTRELALQIFDEVRKITFRTDIFGDVVYGGTAYPSRFENDILVACPGRLSDMFDRGLVSFSEIKFLVLDEADRMLEMGFEEQIEHLVSSRYSDMPKSDDRQTLMFSATFPQRILNLAKRYLRKQYYLLTVGRVGSTTKNITQIIERVDNDEKIDRLFKIIYEHKKTDLVLVFVETKKAAEDLHRELNRQNIPSATIHGDRRQQDRESALASFKSGETPILVATDVASRGLDIPDVSHIIQFDLPAEMDDYTHRIGRTGRAGNKGTATCFYTKNNRKICLELFKYFSEHDQHVPSWFKQEAEQIEGEAMLSRNTIGGGRGGNRRRTAEENQGTWGDTCEPRAPRGNQGPKKRQMFPDDGDHFYLSSSIDLYEMYYEGHTSMVSDFMVSF